MEERKHSAYVFDSYRVDAGERQLLREGEHVHLTPKEFETLLVLVRNRGRVLTKDELLKEIWPDTFVEEANLANNISVLREALGGGGKDNPYIRTVARRGLVASARFTPDGQTVIYSALWEGRASALFTTRPEGPESRAFGLDDALLLSVSRQGEMAVLLRPRVSFSNTGTLARMPLEGGA